MTDHTIVSINFDKINALMVHQGLINVTVSIIKRNNFTKNLKISNIFEENLAQFSTSSTEKKTTKRKILYFFYQ